jgi:transmembrane protein 132
LLPWLLSSQLTRKNQEALLSISVQFDDGTIMPLHYFPSTDYSLAVDTLNNHVVGFDESRSSDAPRIIAVGAGKGELLKVSLELTEQCQRKKYRPMAVTYANVDIDFGRPGDVQSDAAVAIAVTDVFGRTRDGSGGGAKTDRKPAVHLSLDGDRRKMAELSASEPISSSVVGNEKVSAAQRKEVQKNARAAGSAQMSALEISMYTLLGVFCVAVVVFSVNCAIFVIRYRQRKTALHGTAAFEDKDDPENCAPDWVWIGRETLERNAINTACSEALMPPADFNGNHTATSATHIVLTSDGGSAYRSSGSGSASAGNSGAAGGAASNRNSFVSTYKGSECSIQIGSAVPPLAAAMPDCNANVVGDGSMPLARVARGVQTLPRSANKATKTRPVQAAPGGSLRRPAASQRVRPPMIDKQLSTESSLDDDEDDDDDMSSIDSPRHRRRRVAPHHAGKMSRAETLRRLEEAVASGSSDIEWDCNELGVTYDQLMTYFDNLKESTA